MIIRPPYAFRPRMGDSSYKRTLVLGPSYIKALPMQGYPIYRESFILRYSFVENSLGEAGRGKESTPGV